MHSKQCPLCLSEAFSFFINKMNGKEYFRCSQCDLIYLDSTHFISKTQEKSVYLKHQNDVRNEGYQNFVMPLVSYITDHFSPQDKGLDFGSGTGPVISFLLTKQYYTIVQYDPFFSPNFEHLNKTYDYIAACEVVEHFHHPKKEFEQLRNMIKSNASQLISTPLFSDNIDFEK